MTGTGWYNIISLGTRTGNFNPDFSDSSGNPLGDPYGSMAFMSVVVPNNISNGNSIPSIQVLVQGLQLAEFDSSGNFVNNVFTNNPAWVLVDILRRSGWDQDELDLASFAAAAQVCDAIVPTVDLNGNSTLIPRYQCNLILTDRRSAGDVVRGVRNCLRALSAFELHGAVATERGRHFGGAAANPGVGQQQHRDIERRLAGLRVWRQCVLRNRTPLNGQVSFSVSSLSAANSPNRYTVEFQDQFNEYQQDSLSLVDVNDELLCGQDVVVSLTALGLPNLDQAVRAAALQLYKSVYGNTYIEFETSVKRWD